jgi:hypothetical protein
VTSMGIWNIILFIYKYCCNVIKLAIHIPSFQVTTVDGAFFPLNHQAKRLDNPNPYIKLVQQILFIDI